MQQVATPTMTVFPARGRNTGVATIWECECVSEVPASVPKFLNTTTARTSDRAINAR